MQWWCFSLQNHLNLPPLSSNDTFSFVAEQISQGDGVAIKIYMYDQKFVWLHLINLVTVNQIMYMWQLKRMMMANLRGLRGWYTVFVF